MPRPMSWVYDPGPGGGSVPVLIEHLVPVGKLLVKIPEPEARWAGGA